MTRRAFRRIRALGLLGGGALLALAVALLVLATGDAWRRQQAVADIEGPPVTPPQSTRSPTPSPTATPTSVWTAKARQVAQPSAPPPPMALVAQDVDQQVAVRAARVRVVHAAARMGPIRIFVNGASLGQTLSFPGISPYVEIPSGQLRIEGRAAADGKRVWATLLVVAAGQDYSVAVAQPVNGVQVMSLLDDNTLPGYGDMRLRVVNLSNVPVSADNTWMMPTLALSATLPFGHATMYATLANPHGATTLGPAKSLRFGAPVWTMGTVYTVWVMSGKSNQTQGAISEDAYLDFPLLPETGLTNSTE